MKLQSLRINHFGHFVDFDLPLGGSPFVVVHGHNEAGKSTLLEFLRKVLFGFDDRERYSFGDGGEVGGQIVFDLADGGRVDLRRRKGRKNTVQVAIDGVDAGLDEQSFSRLIGDPDANLFKSIFAFGLDELRRAEESLKHDSLRAALYAGGLGGSLNPTELLQDLEQQAAALFKSGGSKPVINSLSREIGELTKSVKSHSVRSDEYEQRRKEWSDKQTQADQLSAQVRELRIQSARTERLVSALPVWLGRRTLLAEREALVVPSNFPANGLEQFKTVVAAINRLTNECEQLKFDLEEAQRKHAAIQLDATLLPLKAEISDCHGLVKSVEEARRDLPLRRAEHAAAQREIDAALRELRPDWTLDKLSSFSIDAATKHSLDELAKRRVALNNDQTALITRQDGSRAELERIAEELAQLQEPRDLSELAALIERSADYVAAKKTLDKELEARAKLTRTLEIQRARLSPPLATEPADVSQLPVPSKELIDKFDREFRDVATKLLAAEQSLAEEEQKLEQHCVELLQLEQQQRAIPKLEELAETRERRDAGWQLIRAQHINGQDQRDAIQAWLGASKSPLPDTYEQVVAESDRIADDIYEHADIVSRREQLKDQIEQAQQAEERKREDVQQRRDEQEALAKKWSEIWQGCELEPLTPDLMRSWIDSFNAYLATFEACQHKDIEIDRLQQRCDEFETTFRQIVPTPGKDVGPALAAAKQQVKSAEVEAEQRKQLERDRKRHQKTHDTVESELSAWQTRDVTWHQEWRTVLTRLELPIEWDTELARQVIERLSATQAKLANLDVLRSRIEGMETRLNEFEPRIHQLGERLNEPIDGERPEMTAKLLHERWTVAAQAQQTRKLLDDTIQELHSKLAAKSDELMREQTRRTEWLSMAQCNSDADFLEVADRARRATELETEITQLTRELELRRSNEPTEEFEAQLQSGDPAVLITQLTEERDRLEQIETASNAAREAAGALRRAFEELDGGDDAARLQEDVARKQAELASQIHRYVPLVFARRLFETAIQRFERENQPELIGDISKLFAALTRGKYVEIERPTSNREAIYVRRHDGAERSPDQLSTGTREQLYLAIRLGYIRHYCRNAEPLPIVMDDVLVNFDQVRARATLETLRNFSRDVQVLFFTCHQYVVDLIKDVAAEVSVIELGDRTLSEAAR